MEISPIEYPCPFMLNRAERYQIRNKHRRLTKVGRETVNLRALLLLLCPTALPLRINLRFLFHAYTLAYYLRMSNTFAYFFLVPVDVPAPPGRPSWYCIVHAQPSGQNRGR
jgi:hypothetical protein